VPGALAYATPRRSAPHDVPDGTADGSNWAPASLNVAAMTVATVVSRGHTTHSIMAVDAVDLCCHDVVVNNL
jgi:hypothetical protein